MLCRKTLVIKGPTRLGVLDVLQVLQSVTVDSDRAVVVFASDESVQGSGFELSWDQGSYCEPQTTLTDPQGTLTDGTPPGHRYRWGTIGQSAPDCASIGMAEYCITTLMRLLH